MENTGFYLTSKRVCFSKSLQLRAKLIIMMAKKVVDYKNYCIQ